MGISGNTPKPLKIFVSYSRRDLEAADRIVAALDEAGFETKIDRRDLPYGEEWQRELGEFIRTSDTVVWLLTPDSISSRWVNWELGELKRLSKRLVPVRVRDIDIEKLPIDLGKIHILPAEGEFDVGRHLDALVGALNSNREWLKEATRLGDRAHQWLAKGKDESVLLRARALTDAEAWARNRPPTAPAISSEILELLLNSRKATIIQQRRTVVLSLAVAVFGIALALFSWWQRNAALINQSTYLAKLSQDQITAGDAATGVQLAISALPKWPFDLDRPRVGEAMRSLYDSLYALRELRTLSGHGNDVNTVHFDPREQRVLTASDDGTGGLWDAASGRRLLSYGPHAGKVYSAQFSPNGKSVVTAAQDNALYVWDTESAVLRGKLVGHTDRITAIQFDASGERVISASRDGTARIWNITTLTEVRNLNGHTGPLTASAFSPDDRYVLTTSNDSFAIVWDTMNGIEIKRLAHPAPVLGGTFDAAGKRIATYAQDQTARVWDVETGVPIAVLPGNSAPLSAAEFCPGTTDEQDCLITAGWDGIARIWDIPAKRALFELNGHSGAVTKVVVDPSGRFVATASRDGLVNLWEIATGKKGLAFGGHTADIFDVSFSASGDFLLSASRDRTARIWQVSSPVTASLHVNLRTSYRSLDISRDGRLVAFGGNNGQIRLLDISSLKKVGEAQAGTVAVTYVAFDPSGHRLIAGSADGFVRLFTLPGLTKDFESTTDMSEIGGGGFASKNLGFKLSTLAGSAAEFDGEELKIRRAAWQSDANAVVVSVVAPDLDRVFVSELNGAARIIEIRSGNLLAEIKGHRGAILHASFDPTGGLLVTASEDGTARVWNTKTGAELQVLSGHTSPVKFVDISNDGTIIATASADSTVRLWRVGNPQPLIGIYRGHIGSVDFVRFVPGGAELISASTDGAIQTWGLLDNTSALLQKAKVVAPRCFTELQLEAFGLTKDRPKWCEIIKSPGHQIKTKQKNKGPAVD